LRILQLFFSSYLIIQLASRISMSASAYFHMMVSS
jgi:hypothetical protein